MKGLVDILKFGMLESRKLRQLGNNDESFAVLFFNECLNLLLSSSDECRIIVWVTRHSITIWQIQNRL